MIHVPDVQATVDWYRDIGFDVVETHGHEGEGLSFAIVAFGSAEVMFNEGGRTSTERRREVDLYVYADDVDEIYQRLKDRVEIVEALHDTFYGMRELIIRDLNRFWITFGQLSIFGKLMEATREGKADLVKATLDRGALKPESLTNALVQATESEDPNAEIVDLLKQAGAQPPAPVAEQILQAHAGKYKSDTGMEVVISLKEGKLFASPGGEGQIRLIAIDQTTFRPLIFNDVTVRFNLEGSKTIGFVLQQGGSATQLHRVAES